MLFVNGLAIGLDGRAIVSEVSVASNIIFSALLQSSLTPEIAAGSPTPTYSRASIGNVLAYEAYAAPPVVEEFAYANGNLSTVGAAVWNMTKTGSPECVVASQRLSADVAGPAGRSFYWPKSWASVGSQPHYSEGLIYTCGQTMFVGANYSGATGSVASGYYAQMPSTAGESVNMGFVKNGALTPLFGTLTTVVNGDRIGIYYDPSRPEIVDLYKNGVYQSSHDFSTDIGAGLPQGGVPFIGGATAGGNLGKFESVQITPNLPGSAPDRLTLITAIVNEARFTGARKLFNNSWVDTFSNGDHITPANGGDPSVCDENGPFGYLAEGAGTNLYLQSNNFLAPNWVQFQTTDVTQNAGIAPDGTNTAWLVKVTATASSYTWFSQSVGALANATVSCYFKAEASARVSIGVGSSAEDISEFNLDTQTIVLGANMASGSITPAGNGWYRCAVTRKDLPSSDPTYLGLFQASGQPESFYIWGAQFEAAITPSSYIPTTTGTVTRNNDLLTYASAGNIDNTVGTLVAEYQTPNVTFSGTFGVVANGSSNGWLRGYDNRCYMTQEPVDYNLAYAFQPNRMNVVKGAWSGTTRKLQLDENQIRTAAFSGNMGVTPQMNMAAPAGAGTSGIIRRVQISNIDLSTRSTTAVPFAIDPSDSFLGGWRYRDGDAALRVIDDIGETIGDVHLAGMRINEAGELYIYMTDAAAPETPVYIDGILTTHAGAMCCNTGKAIDHWVHGWPVAADGSVCVTPTATPVSPGAFNIAFNDAFD
jgi:hypothetical protein